MPTLQTRLILVYLVFYQTIPTGFEKRAFKSILKQPCVNFACGGRRSPTVSGAIFVYTLRPHPEVSVQLSC